MSCGCSSNKVNRIVSKPTPRKITQAPQRAAASTVRRVVKRPMR